MGYRARGSLTSGQRGGSLFPERWTRVVVCCLAPEDGQGSGSARQPRISRPSYGIRPKASKGPEGRRSRVLQNPHAWVQIPPSPLGNGMQRQTTAGNDTAVVCDSRDYCRNRPAWDFPFLPTRGSKSTWRLPARCSTARATDPCLLHRYPLIPPRTRCPRRSIPVTRGYRD